MDTTPDPSPDDEGAEPGPAATGGAGTETGDAGAGTATGIEGDRSPDDPDLAADATDEESVVGDPLRFSNWMKRSATGAVMTGISLGLREALEHKKNEPAFMIEASGQPDDPDNPIALHFDPDSPADTVAVIRRSDPSHLAPPAGMPPEDRSPPDRSPPDRTPPDRNPPA